ncbi:MAG: outer membrane beta-barrel protein [Terracidiphilus sp.]|jgi:opacity protein-like surface antigen
MRVKPYLGLILAVLFVCAAYSALAQTAPAATESRFPLAIGAGLSDYNTALDGQNYRLLGGTLWIDYSLIHVPSFLRGIGIEAEARDLNLDHKNKTQPNLRQDTAEGGLIYAWPHFRNLHPYGKFFAGYGNLDYNGRPNEVYLNHDSTNFLAAGGGLDYRVVGGLWVRADYEYQSWPNMPRNTGKTGLKKTNYPQGFTIGALYHFGPHPSR